MFFKLQSDRNALEKPREGSSYFFQGNCCFGVEPVFYIQPVFLGNRVQCSLENNARSPFKQITEDISTSIKPKTLELRYNANGHGLLHYYTRKGRNW